MYIGELNCWDIHHKYAAGTHYFLFLHCKILCMATYILYVQLCLSYLVHVFTNHNNLLELTAN